MPTMTYSHAREHFAEVLAEAESSREAVIITRRGHESMAIVPAAELAGLLETAHLLRSPRNARRLVSALNRSLNGEGMPQDLGDLAKEFGLAGKDRDTP